MKAIVRATAVLGAAALLAAGCSSGGSTNTSTGGVTKLTVWTGFTGPDRPAYDKLIADFNASHPNIQVSMDVQPWATLAQKLPSAWATGQGPDLATPSSDPGSIYQYIKTNSVTPLDSAVGTGDAKINSSAFPPAVVKAFSQDGKLYAAPANLATLVLYYNKDMFSAAGITDAPKTLADFQADAVKLTVGGDKPSQYGLSLADHQTIQMWPILQWMNGGDIVDTSGCAQINKPASVDALKSWTDLVINKHISPVGQTGADADTLFSAKKAAMEINGPWAAAGFQQAGVNLGIAQVPVGPGGPVTLASSVPMLVAKSSKHQSQALEFLAWWTGKTAQTTFAQASGFPPVRTDMADAVASNPTVAQFAQALPNAKLYLPGLTQFAQIDSDIYVPFVGKITRGSDVQKEADSAASAINTLTGCKS